MEFVDTNVLVYAHDRSAGSKRVVAAELIARLIEAEFGALSTQVLAEFYSVATAKGMLSAEDARKLLVFYGRWPLHHPNLEHLLEAVALREQYRIGWWDALILNSAIQLGCTTLWTENFSDGQQFGDLTFGTRSGLDSCT